MGLYLLMLSALQLYSVPSFSSFKSDISVESSSVASSFDDVSSETSSPSVPDEPVDPSFWSSPLPVSGEYL